jgi:hypothetical protein
MRRLALLPLLLLGTTLPACVLEIGVEGEATLDVANHSVANGLVVSLEPIDDDDLLADGATLERGAQATLAASVGLYELLLVDNAGDGCVVRRFAFVPGGHARAEIYDHDLVACAEQTPPFPDDPTWP